MRRQTWGQAMYLPLVFFFYGLGVGKFDLIYC